MLKLFLLCVVLIPIGTFFIVGLPEIIVGLSEIRDLDTDALGIILLILWCISGGGTITLSLALIKHILEYIKEGHKK